MSGLKNQIAHGKYNEYNIPMYQLLLYYKNKKKPAIREYWPLFLEKVNPVLKSSYNLKLLKHFIAKHNI